MKKPRIEVHEHEIWVGNVVVDVSTHRRICGILTDPKGRKRVYYSKGGDSTLSCLETRFKHWIRKTKATCKNPKVAAV